MVIYTLLLKSRSLLYIDLTNNSVAQYVMKTGAGLKSLPILPAYPDSKIKLMTVKVIMVIRIGLYSSSFLLNLIFCFLFV